MPSIFWFWNNCTSCICYGDLKGTINNSCPDVPINGIDMDTHTILPTAIVFTVENWSSIVSPFRSGSHLSISVSRSTELTKILMPLVRRWPKDLEGVNRSHRVFRNYFELKR